jgi:hypothetical protein
VCLFFRFFLGKGIEPLSPVFWPAEAAGRGWGGISMLTGMVTGIGMGMGKLTKGAGGRTSAAGLADL